MPMFFCDFKGPVHYDTLRTVRLLCKIYIYSWWDSFVYSYYSRCLV